MSVGTLFKSAVEFQPIDIAPAKEAATTVRRVNADYVVLGQLNHVWRRVWVLDFGLRAYADHLDWNAKSRWLKGTVRLRPDAFQFREGHAFIPGVPRMTYTWRVAGIWRLLGQSKGPVAGEDPHLQSIERTNAMTDDAGHGAYVLLCAKVD